MHLNFIYILSVVLLSAGIYMMIAEDNYLKKIIGLSIFQTACIVFFVALGKAGGGIPPLAQCTDTLNCSGFNYSAALPQVLMLTAIVVGFATISVALAMIYQIKKHFNTLSESKINADN